MNTGCSCFLLGTPVISTFFLTVSRKCRFLYTRHFTHVHLLHPLTQLRAQVLSVQALLILINISKLPEVIPTYTPSDNSSKGSCFLALLSTHCAKKIRKCAHQGWPARYKQPLVEYYYNQCQPWLPGGVSFLQPGLPWQGV